MALELKQSLKLSQQLIMTPQLQQAIKLLQVSRLELIDVINQEMEENPLLEEAMSDDYPDTDNITESDEIKTQDGEEFKETEHAVELTGEGDGREEFDWDNYLEDYGSVGVTYERRDGEAPAWDNLLTAKSSLTDHLMWQLKLSPLTEMEMAVGEQIICNLDQNGYLAATPQDIIDQTGVDDAFVERVLQKIQEFDPPGIAARDLKECLLIQARVLGVSNPVIESIIKDHLKELELKNYSQIARKLKVPLPEVLLAISVITNMDPKPGSIYNEEKVESVIPDVYVFKMGDDYKIILNDDGLPRLRISNFYKEIMGGLSGDSRTTDNKKYIKERVQAATWLIKSIQQRQNTIFKVAESILKYQREFFDKGINFLKPLVLRDIAEDVEMHESTISRVVANKYMHTPRGIFVMKYFFSSSINTTDGETIASKSVKEDIKKIISEEDPVKPYNDSEIVKMLAKSGISIARRTVAKYREMMGILPSSRRKKYV